MKNLYFCIRKSIAYEAEKQVVLSVISFVVMCLKVPIIGARSGAMSHALCSKSKH